MTSHTFHGIKSPIRAINLLEFPNTTRSDRFDSLVQQHVGLDFTHLPYDHELHLRIKSKRIPKNNAK
ncbi:uncharacterized protein G2W53_033416 [Senna tora]|uniref:Uncharacterized protein n=1 Tax=Senna tora TaxID=362788 RepID=A0A834SY79_9FABA|nr:uncharacterized protein G2W53_033416 [Senna tora]